VPFCLSADFTHTRMHTYTRTLSLLLSVTQLTHTRAFTLSVKRTHKHSHAHSHSLSLTLSHTRAPANTQMQTHIHKNYLSPPSPSLFCSLKVKATAPLVAMRTCAVVQSNSRIPWLSLSWKCNRWLIIQESARCSIHLHTSKPYHSIFSHLIQSSRRYETGRQTHRA